MEEFKIEKEQEKSENQLSKKQLEKEAEALENHQPPSHQPVNHNFSIPHFQHVTIPRFRVPVIPPMIPHANGQIRIFVAPPQRKF